MCFNFLSFSFNPAKKNIFKVNEKNNTEAPPYDSSTVHFTVQRSAHDNSQKTNSIHQHVSFIAVPVPRRPRHKVPCYITLELAAACLWTGARNQLDAGTARPTKVPQDRLSPSLLKDRNFSRGGRKEQDKFFRGHVRTTRICPEARFPFFRALCSS